VRKPSDPRRPLAQILDSTDPVDVLLINPESTFAQVEPSEIAVPLNLQFLSSQGGADLLGDQDHEPNHGILQVAGILRNHGISVDVLDLNAIAYLERQLKISPWDRHNLLEVAMRQRRPRIVGLSAMAPNLALACRYSRILRNCAPNTFQVLGGLATEATASNLPDSSFDVVFRGQAERGFVEVVDTLLENDISNANSAEFNIFLRPSWLDPGIAQKSEIRAQSARPAYDLLPSELPLIPRVFASRGCPAKCSFCSPAAALGYGVHVRMADETLAEIEWLHETFQFDYWLLGDLTLFLRNKQILRLLDTLRSRSTIKPWWCQTQVAMTSADAMFALHAAKCVQVALGFEDFSDPNDRIRRKHVSFQAAVDACKQAKNAGLLTQSYWMFGLPEDSMPRAISRIRDMCWFVDEQLMDTLHISFLVPYPGTPYHDKPEEYGLSIDTTRFAEFLGSDGGYYNCLPVHSTANLSSNEIFLLTRLGIASAASRFAEARLKQFPRRCRLNDAALVHQSCLFT